MSMSHQIIGFYAPPNDSSKIRVNQSGSLKLRVKLVIENTRKPKRLIEITYEIGRVMPWQNMTRYDVQKEREKQK